ncbi:Crp/Fnr family transcriptional regulator [Lactococcus formosensis]|jgi:cAMP-binding proteins - catabolite gene activator and regulatory subunit of cAMP-dependent protein kinases|uniref:Crp/Fnr family transcriptional regulator n=1 Tax=Lactococcus formosensis TaxID=1281486 RepID=A0A9Q8Y210_9LACT|nr:Crp/Fnr family transcriptional regulator [Lactococcus formosensis]NHI67297.1 Crp/Fnr family transcriptional regulator [Lactococcus garvieae]MCH1722756.1 Crp/Fnr family transcriptional regulator [Lactococcus formosensis]MCO7179816.1 Crp/Fnr family transcriptional regulator [Lactococcus formosensis]MDG6110907.1 Crp/Fnr family transcriptional regulator [Lactococcus formosensis]MDG6113093.1 Crp/Fnr family transcriptional regulator [Lactococcus formosensis]
MTKEFIEYLLRLLEEKEVNVVTQRRHSYVMYQGIESDYVYILKEGVAKISNIMRDGREFNIAYVTEPDFVSLLEEKQETGISALFNVRVESEEASFYRVQRQEFWKWVMSDLTLFRIVDDFYQRRLAMNLELLQKMTINGKKGAVCACINSLINEFGIKKRNGILIDFPVTNEDIAGFCGISTRNSVNRIIRDLKTEEIIDIIDNRIMVYNSEYFEDYIS